METTATGSTRRLTLIFGFLAFALFGIPNVVRGGTLTATWNANPESNIAGYRLSYGAQSGTYTVVVDVGNVTSKQLSLPGPQRYYFAVRAYNTSSLISGYSTEVFFDVPAGPALTSLSPTSGPVGTSVTIMGTNFGATKGTSTVRLNGMTAAPTSWSPTSIVAPVTAGATTGNVVVTVGGVASNALIFTVTAAPTLTGLSPTRGPVGTPVTITGTNFGATQGTSTVRFNGVTAAPTSWSATSIVVPVPVGATTGSVVISVGGAPSNGLSFKVNHSRHLTNANDFDGDRKSDVVVFRPNTGSWFVLRSSSGFANGESKVWGTSSDIPVPEDYDGDGKTDIAIFRPSTGVWAILLSSTNFASYTSVMWGASADIPVAGDYDGDGATDIAIYRPSTGVWWVLRSSSNYTTYFSHTWGLKTDIVMPSDYDGDGKTDLAVYRPSTAMWYLLSSKANYSYATVVAVSWGGSTARPVVGDYDGDSKADLAVYTTADGWSATWKILLSGSNYSTSMSMMWGAWRDWALPLHP